MDEQWQLYNPQGEPIVGMGAVKQDVFTNGLLHGGSHVWIWRTNNGTPEVLVQKRSATKETWPNLYDISAAGHIDVSEQPLAAAVREVSEEIGIKVVGADLQLIGLAKIYMTAPSGSIENEFQWLYLYELTGDVEFSLQTDEVESLQWKSLDEFKKDVSADSNIYVPHGKNYYSTVINAIETQIHTRSETK